MVKRTKHYSERFDERICSKTKRQQEFTDRAYNLGKDSSQVKDSRLKAYLKGKEHYYEGEIIKFYCGRVYVFINGVAITVFPAPNRIRSLS